MRFLNIHKTILFGSVLLTMTSCTLPPFVGTVNNIKTGVDGLLMLSGEKTTNDRVLSDVTEMDCRMDRLLMSKEICKEHKQAKDRAIVMEELRKSLNEQEGVTWEYHHNP